MTSLKTSIKTITYLSDIGCLEIQGASLDGVTYPYVTIDVSSKSHPFYTGKLRTVASEGNVARFTQRFGRFVSTKKGA